MEQLINFIIRPPRAEYNPKNDLLDEEFILKGKWYQRKDLEVVNIRGDVLKCSHYMPIVPPEGIKLPCVIYCHGNSGCRTDASEAAVILLPSNITIFTLDFSGSGVSGGEHVTLGWNEKDDLRAVVDYLRADGNVSLIGLWGRSMGAVTSLMYGAEDPSIAGMVLDSPFSDLVALIMELVDTYKIRLPKFTVKFAIQYMRRAIQKKAKFDITDLNTIKVAKSCFVPVLFGHANDDDFIQPHHSDRIFDAYVGDKNIIKFEGDHNSLRPQFYFDSISIFFKNILHPPEDEIGNTYFDLSHAYYSKDRWSLVDDLELSGSLLGSPVGGAATSTDDDAIKQLRNKKPISSIVVPAFVSSKDNQFDSQVSDSCPSSSSMISFELSKGGSSSSPHGCSHVPRLIDGDEFLEYPLGPSPDFPTNVEEEEKMFMKAILMSLKDSETISSDSATDLHKPEPGPMNDQDSSVFTLSNFLKFKSISMPATDEQKPASNTSTCNRSLTNAGIITPKEDCATVIKKPTSDVGPHRPIGEETSWPTSHDDFDLVDRTRVTVQVEKSRSTLRRWDLNFFRNK